MNSLDESCSKGETASEIDFPAAHSADTTWFAVDKNGHVAIFETGEAGAMPEAAAGGEDFDTEPLERALNLPRKRDEFGEIVADWSRRLYVYEHGENYENWIAGPYTRQNKPTAPVTIDQLPEPIRSELKQAQFENLTFADCITIQPVDHLKCAAWDPAYVTSDGKRIRAIPGYEDDYPQYHADYLEGEDIGEGLEVEPPAKPLPASRGHGRPSAAQPKKPWWWPF